MVVYPTVPWGILGTLRKKAGDDQRAMAAATVARRTSGDFHTGAGRRGPFAADDEGPLTATAAHRWSSSVRT